MNKMLSFVRLDLKTLKPYTKSFYMFAIIVIFIGVTNNSLSMVYSMVMIGLPTILSYPFAISEKNSLDTLYSTLSLDRKEVVVGRYIFVFLTAMTAIMVLLILVIVKSNSANLEMSLEENLVLLSLLTMIFSIIISFQFPIFFKLGYAKAKLYTYFPLLLLLLIVGVIPYLVKRLNVDIDWQGVARIFIENTVLMLVLPILIGIASLSVSCMISVKIYKAKDI